MKKKGLYIGFGICIVILAIALLSVLRNPTTQQTDIVTNTDTVYVAVEEDGEIAVIDVATNAVLKGIDLSEQVGATTVEYMAHNVQVAPDGQTVWVTANAMMEDEHAGSDGGDHMKNENGERTPQDQVIVIDPLQDTIIQRIPLGEDMHLSHVVLTPDSTTALVAAQEKGELYIVDARSYTVEKTIQLEEAYQPHGLRIAPDGQTAYIAMIEGKAMGVLDIASGVMSYVDLNGAAVQTAVTPDGQYVLTSLYDTKSIALYNTANQQVSYISLPAEAKGPVQLYPTPDSQFVYVADQGYYFDQPTGDTVYKVDIKSGTIVGEVKTGQGPHGVVVSPDGQRVYVTNLLSNDVSVISAENNTVLSTINVGKQPNGISIWSKQFGGTQ